MSFSNDKQMQDFILKSCINHDLEMIKKVAPEINLEYSYSKGWKLLHYAVYLRQFEVVKLLLKFGANPNSINDRGRTPLHLAAKFGCYHIATKLIMSRADCSILDVNGNSALDIASRYIQYDVLRLLLKISLLPESTVVYKKYSVFYLVKRAILTNDIDFVNRLYYDDIIIYEDFTTFFWTFTFNKSKDLRVTNSINLIQYSCIKGYTEIVKTFFKLLEERQKKGRFDWELIRISKYNSQEVYELLIEEVDMDEERNNLTVENYFIDEEEISEDLKVRRQIMSLEEPSEEDDPFFMYFDYVGCRARYYERMGPYLEY
jgi:ankyrin repeat protein